VVATEIAAEPAALGGEPARDAQTGKFVTAPAVEVAPTLQVPPIEGAPVEEQAAPEAGDAENTMVMQQAMQQALDRIEQMKSTIDEAREQKENDIKALQVSRESEAKRDSEQQTKIATLEAFISKAKKEELKTAKQQRDSTFNRLTATLSALECDLGNKQSAPTDPKSQLIFESNIAEAAIKQLVTTSDKVSDMDSENRKLKRQHEKIESNLCNFETGRVEANAANKRHQPTLVADSFIEWRARNPSALKWQVDAELQKRANSQVGVVVVNASRQKWSEPTHQDGDGPKRPMTSSVFTNYPEMASKLMQLNTGKLIGSEETVHMMQTTAPAVGSSRQMPW